MRLTWPSGGALVTGGTGGIGAAVVSTLAAAGIPVAFTYRSHEAEAQRMVEGHRGLAHIRALPWSGAGAREAADLAARAAAVVGPIRCFVSCSGIASTKAFHAMEETEWREIIETNLTAAIAVSRAVVTPMMKAGSGRIVLIGSVSGLRGIRGHSVYAASKAALHGLTRALAMECARFGVTVNSVAPGYIDTPMLDAIPPRERETLAKGIPAGRLGTPAEVAALIAFLLSDQAAYITGQTLAVDGGLSA